MTTARKTRFVDCNPRWGTHYGEHLDRYITFDCPEGHVDCHHTIPVSPKRNGTPWLPNSVFWERRGDDFATMTIAPSIKRTPTNNDQCAMHVEITNGQITFAGDSR